MRRIILATMLPLPILTVAGQKFFGGDISLLTKCEEKGTEMRAKSFLAYMLAALMFFCMPSAVNADDKCKLLREVEPDAALTSEQGNLEVVSTLNDIGDDSEVYYVVREHEKLLQGVVQIKDGKLVPRLPREYQYIDQIINADYRDSTQQYVYVCQDTNQHYVYDLVKDKMTKLHLSGEEISLHHKYKYYLGESSNGPLFDLCGVCCGEKIIPFHRPGFMELDKESGKFMYHDEWGASQEIDLTNHPPYVPWQYFTRTDKHSRRVISYWIDYPRTDTSFDREPRQWISQTIHRTLPYTSSDLELYITSEDKSPKGMYDYYSGRFFINDSINESLGGEDFFSGYNIMFLKKWESESFITYNLSVSEDSPINSWMDPTSWARLVTFDKQTGMEMDETDIFKEGFEDKINKIVWSVLKENLWKSMTVNMKENPYLSMEDAKEEYESILEYLGGDEYFDWIEGLSSIALTPQGVLVDYPTKAKEGTLFTIPYEKIKPYLTAYMGKDSKDVFLESVQKASSDAETIYREDFNKTYIPSEELLAFLAQEQGKECGEYLLVLSQMAERCHLEEKAKRAVSLRQDYLDTVERLAGCQNDAWETNAQRQLKDLLYLVA